MIYEWGKSGDKPWGGATYYIWKWKYKCPWKYKTKHKKHEVIMTCANNNSLKSIHGV